MDPALLDALRACIALDLLGQRGDTLHLTLPYPASPPQRAARRAVLAALLAAYGPMTLFLVDDEPLDLPRAGDGWRVDAGTDLAALEDAALHVGAWLLVRSRHDDPRPLLGGRDLYRTQVLADLCARGDLDAAIASFWNDLEWLLVARPITP